MSTPTSEVLVPSPPENLIYEDYDDEIKSASFELDLVYKVTKVVGGLYETNRVTIVPSLDILSRKFPNKLYSNMSLVF